MIFALELSHLYWSLLAAAVAVVSGTWFLATVVMNIPGGSARLASMSRLTHFLSLIPTWSFFAPIPVTQDLALLYRDRLENGEISPWREVIDLHASIRALRVLWNPKGRAEKAVSDACDILGWVLRKLVEPSPEKVVLTVPYLLLLNRISNMPVGVGTCARQFALVRHAAGGGDIAVVFVSNFHNVTCHVDLVERSS